MIFSKISFTVAAALLSVTSAIPTAAVADSDSVGVSSRAAAVDVSDGVGISSRAAAVDVSDGVGISSRAAAVAVSDSVGVSSRALTFNNLLVILLENTDFSSAIADPNLKAFASSGVLFSNWLAVSHPSQPNYIALTSGSTNGVTSDTSTTINVKNIADLLEAKGLTWKSYQENLPSTCFLGTVSADGLYFRKHNPFISFTDIQTNATRCAKIVPATQLTTDISQNTLPTFGFYTPNIKNDGHDTGVTFAGNWLRGFLSSTGVTSHFDVVLVLFDEDATAPSNQVYAAIAGKAVTNIGTTDATALNHFSLLATLETNFGLGNLGKSDATAKSFSL